MSFSESSRKPHTHRYLRSNPTLTSNNGGPRSLLQNARRKTEQVLKNSNGEALETIHVMLLPKCAVSRVVELAFGVGLQAGFKVVKLNETTTLPPLQYIYIQQSQTYVQTVISVLSQQSMNHKAIHKHAE
jgi:hypothetical protein